MKLADRSASPTVGGPTPVVKEDAGFGKLVRGIGSPPQRGICMLEAKVPSSRDVAFAGGQLNADGGPDTQTCHDGYLELSQSVVTYFSMQLLWG